MRRILRSRTTALPTRLVAVSAVTLLVVVTACHGKHDAATTTLPPTASSTTVTTTGTGSSVASTTTSGGAATSSTSTVTSTGGSAPTSTDPSTVTTLNETHNFNFHAPPTDAKDTDLLGVYTTFMHVLDQIEQNLSDQGLRDQLKGITTSDLNDFLQKAYDDNVAQGVVYRVVEPPEYHPFVFHSDRDGFRTVGDCFYQAAARVDSAGNLLPGESLDRQSKGFQVEFELHSGKWLAADYEDPASNCLVGQ